VAFMGSWQVAELYQPVDAGTFRSIVASVFEETGLCAGDELLNRLCERPIALHLQDWRQTQARLRELNISGEEAQGLRRFILAQHVLNNFPTLSPFEPESPYPAQTAEVAEFGAAGLLRYGKDQFAMLRDVCENLAKWARAKHPRVALLESPLGNVVPVAALREVLRRNGVEPEVLTLSLARDSAATTYREAIDNITQSLAADPRPLIYVDDVLTGTRFGMTVKALSESARNRGIAEPVAIALAFPPHQELREKHLEIREETRTIVQSFPHATEVSTWVNMPRLPRLELSSGQHFAYQSPVIWGENDLVAGRRRVNLIFNLIEEFNRSLSKLTGKDSEWRNRLRQLWSEDLTGQRFKIRDHILRESIRAASQGVNWDSIITSAKGKFPDDYNGRINERPDTAFVYGRITWLTEEVRRAALKGAEPAAAQMLVNALTTLFSAGYRRGGDPRNRDFCFMFYSYHPPLLRLHQRVVEGVLA
jgi:hypothetical protein